jgi:phytoene dehydrogenase-like protein
MKDFDVIIIGSGIGGLVSAGLLASKGMRPLVIEAHKSPGGYVSSFKRREYIFDSAVDCISGVGPDGLIGRVLSLLDVDNEMDFLQVEPIRRSIFPDFNVDVYSDLNMYIEELISLFPAESGGIKEFFKMACRVYDDVLLNIDIFSEGRSGGFKISADVIWLKNSAYENILKEYVSDPRLIAVLSDRCPFIGLSPSKVSAFQMIMLVMSYFKLGAYRPRGGFQRLSDVLVKGIRKKGGKVILGNETKRIIYDGADCQGVICKSGDEYKGRYIISNGDFINTFSNLLGGKYADMAETLLASPGVSTSFFIVYGSIKGKHKGHSSIGYFPSYDLSYFFKSESAFKDDNTIGITIASVEDSSRAPEGCGTIVMHEMVQESEIFAHRGKCAGLAVKKVERVIPDLKGRIEVIDTAIPATLQKYTKNHLGAAFGWKQIPGSFPFSGHGLNNFYIAGHWSEMGGGVLAAAYSGAKAAEDILAKEGISIGK